MKLVIDIPNYIYESVKNSNICNYERFKIKEAIRNGIQLDDIKAEINNLPKLRYSSGERVYLDEVLEIIDKNIVKEKDND